MTTTEPQQIFVTKIMGAASVRRTFQGFVVSVVLPDSSTGLTAFVSGIDHPFPVKLRIKCFETSCVIFLLVLLFEGVCRSCVLVQIHFILSFFLYLDEALQELFM